MVCYIFPCILLMEISIAEMDGHTGKITNTIWSYYRNPQLSTFKKTRIDAQTRHYPSLIENHKERAKKICKISPSEMNRRRVVCLIDS